MTIIDTSVWIEFLRAGDEQTAELITGGQALVHPYVLAELACGPLDDRSIILAHLDALGAPSLATVEETLELLETRRLYGQGLSFVDVNLLASALITACGLVTYDRALQRAARRLGIGRVT